MKKTYQLKTNAIKGEQQVIDIAPGTGKAPVVVPAAAAARYELIDTATRAAPDTIRVMRKGKNLQIFFDGEKEPGAVIENYYEAHTDGSPTLVGSTEQGALYEYIPENASSQAIATQLADSGNTYGMALGGQELPATGAAVGLLAPVVGAISPWLLGAGALGAAAVVGGGKGGGDTGGGGVIVYEANTGKKTAITLNPVTGDNIITTGENSGSIALTGKVSGNFAAGDIVTIYANGKTYTGTAASDGSFSIGVPASELATDKDTRIEAKVTGTGGDTANAAQDYTVETSTTAGKTTALSIDPIATDNFINTTEASGSINVTGKATGAFSTSDTVTLTINGKTYSGTPKPDGTFSIAVPAAELIADQDTTVDAVLGTSASALQNYGVDLDRPSNADVGLSIAIATDADNSGVVNISELNGANKLTSHISVNDKAQVGDKVMITATNNGGTPTTIEHVLTASDIKNGFDVAFDKPADGTMQVVSANYVDATGNAANDTQATDRALLDATAPSNVTVGLKIEITNDNGGQINLSGTVNDGFINAAEKPADNFLTSHISVNRHAVVGDKVIISADNDGVAQPTITRVLSANDITNGFDVTFACPAEGKLQTVTANYVDSAGNAATDSPPQVKDTAKIDTVAMNFGSVTLESTLSSGVHTLSNAIFNHATTEPGKYELKVGNTLISSGVFDGTKLTLTPGISTSGAVQLDFWDMAGNHSNYTLGDYKVDSNTHFVV